MSYQKQPSSTQSSSPDEARTNSSGPRLVKVREWLRSRTGRVVVPLISLLVGIVVGVTALELLGESGVGSISVVPASSKGGIIVDADRALVTQLVRKNLESSGMPGRVQNVNVNLTYSSQLMVRGEDVLSILGIQVIRPFTFNVELYVSSCFLKIHIVHADFSNLPVTRFAQSFENQINEQLQKKPEGLPSGFQYCTTGVRTEPEGMFVTYTATPI